MPAPRTNELQIPMAIMVATNTPCPRRSAPIPRKSESPGTPENQRRGAVRTQPMVVGQRSPMRSRSQPMKGARHMEGIWRPRNMDLGGCVLVGLFFFLFLEFPFFSFPFLFLFLFLFFFFSFSFSFSFLFCQEREQERNSPMIG